MYGLLHRLEDIERQCLLDKGAANVNPEDANLDEFSRLKKKVAHEIRSMTYNSIYYTRNQLIDPQALEHCAKREIN